mgnify:CR=1 FL=1
MSPSVAVAMEEKFDFSFKWTMAGQGPMFRQKATGGINQVAHGNGHVQVGGGISTGAGTRIGGIHGSDHEPVSDDLAEVCDLLQKYASKAFLKGLKEKLLKIKELTEE